MIEIDPSLDSQVLIDYPIEDEGAAPSLVGAAPIWEKQLAVWKDPFTLPNSRMECVKWAKPWPGAKICVGHKYQWQWMYGHLWLTITLAEPADIAQAINESLRDAAVAACIAGILGAVSTGGAAFEAARDAFVAVFEVSLAKRITTKLISVRAHNRPAWGDWE